MTSLKRRDAGPRSRGQDALAAVPGWRRDRRRCVALDLPLSYDARNRPVTVTAASGPVTYAYGPDDERLKKSYDGETTLYLGADIELKDGVWTKHLHPNVRKVGSTLSWMHRDHLASVRATTDATGALAARNAFAPYGEREDVVESTDPDQPRTSKGFIGEKDDPETGLLYLHARYYDPVLGRFVTPD